MKGFAAWLSMYYGKLLAYFLLIIRQKSHFPVKARNEKSRPERALSGPSAGCESIDDSNVESLLLPFFFFVRPPIILSVWSSSSDDDSGVLVLCVKPSCDRLLRGKFSNIKRLRRSSRRDFSALGWHLERRTKLRSADGERGKCQR